MKKFLYITAVLATVALTSVSCKNEVDDLFDQSAAERVQSAVDEYTAVLTANGGKWVMEYFTTSKEPGYIYVFTFNADGSVVISGKNKWIGDVYKSEKSLWTMLSDNGPVLSLNSYNKVFHVFASPEDIPNETDEDPDETGYGHSGDYEFIFMEYTADVVRLKGKKYGASIYLRRLPADTDDKEYFAKIDDMKSALFSTKFTKLMITDALGQRFYMTGATTGIVTIYPINVDPIDQHSTANFIITTDGIRFMNRVEVEREDRTAEPLAFQTFNLQEDGSLLSVEDATVITALPLSTYLSEKDYTLSAKLDQMFGKYAEQAAIVDADIKTAYKNKRQLKGVSFSAANNSSKVLTKAVIIEWGTSTSTVKTAFFVEPEVSDDNTLSYKLTGEMDDNATKLIAAVPSVRTLVDILVENAYKCSTENILMPAEIKIESDNNGNDYINVTVQ